MKLKTRLIIAFFIIILVPFFLFALAFFGLSSYQKQIIEENYGIPLSLDELSDSMQIMGKSTQTIFEEIKSQTEEDVDLLLDQDYLDSINDALKKRYSWLLVRKGNEIYYNGSGRDATSLIEALPAYRSYSSSSDGGSYIGKDIQAFVKQLDVQFGDESQGSVFIISSVSALGQSMKRLTGDLVFATAVILVFTAMILIVWIYAGFNSPLKKLREATHRIKEEDFDFEIKETGKGELSQLCRDFDEMRQRLKEQAEQKEIFDRQSKELISNISHDLKTPITAVKGYVEGIMDGVADTPEKMDRYIRTIYIKANDMDRLINELTFYSKIDTNRIPYTFAKIHVADYFEDCVEELSYELKTQGIGLTYFNYLNEDVLIIADAEQLKRVINNIVSNSVKYLDKKKGIINIRLKDAGDFIQVEIEDNGKGIAQKDLPKIFDRFYRTDTSRNSTKGGSGIGLSIVRKILEDHGGKVWATSKEGVGTVMCFVLRKYQEVPADEQNTDR